MDDKIKRLQEHSRLHAEMAAAWRERGYSYPPPIYPRLDNDLVNMSCGARTRAGTPCKRRDIYHSGRCKLHGGMSSGPKTDEGRARSRENLKRRWPTLGTP